MTPSYTNGQSVYGDMNVCFQINNIHTQKRNNLEKNIVNTHAAIFLFFFERSNLLKNFSVSKMVKLSGLIFEGAGRFLSLVF